MHRCAFRHTLTDWNWMAAPSMLGSKQRQTSLHKSRCGETLSYCSHLCCAPLQPTSNPSFLKVHYYTVNLPTYDHLPTAVICGSHNAQPNARFWLWWIPHLESCGTTCPHFCLLTCRP